jgi:dephospho-CoA kinase
MIKLGLTGSIGMGKSTIAAMFADEGVPVWDADAAVHRLYAEDDALKASLAEAFGDVLSENRVDRLKLSAALHQDPNGFERLNRLVHPRVVEDRAEFFRRHADAAVVVADIPLLYETAAERLLDKVVVVSAPPDVQRERVLARSGMTEAKFAAIAARQIPDLDKRRRADYVIDTSQSLDACREQVRDIIAELKGKAA